MTETLDITLLKKDLVDNFGYTWTDLDGSTKEELEEELAYVKEEKRREERAVKEQRSDDISEVIDDCDLKNYDPRPIHPEDEKVLKRVKGGIAIDLAIGITKVIQATGMALLFMGFVFLCIIVPLKGINGVHSLKIDIGLPLTAIVTGIISTFISVSAEARLEDKVLDRICQEKIA